MSTDSLKRTKARYKKKVERVYIELYPTDEDIKDRLNSRFSNFGEPKTTYIKRLIREDIERDREP